MQLLTFQPLTGSEDVRRPCKKLFIVGNLTHEVRIDKYIPPETQEIIYHSFTYTGKLAGEYAQKKGLPHSGEAFLKMGNEFALANFYEAIVVNRQCDGVTIFYHEMTFALEYLYGAAKARGLFYLKKKL